MKYLKYLVVTLLLCFPFSVFAVEVEPTMNCDKSLLSINETTTCTVTVDVQNGGIKAFQANIDISSNLELSNVSVLETWNNSSSNNMISVQTESPQSGSLSIATFQVTAKSVIPETSESIRLTNISITDENDTPSSYDSITKTIRVPSNNASLQSLTIDSGILLPNFDPDILEYTVDGYEKDSITIGATAHQNASITGTGKKSLQYGENIFEIVVKAEAGNTKTYRVIVTRVDNRSSDTSLKSLTVNETSIDLIAGVKNYKVNLS